ncbi:MAG: Ureidoglycolate lyase [Planctomycetes bacterium ADurb.Bin412]|nr:MAG: Ureidoglycolate lyase [Planctomycetes bacterium ADurb.Bin412]
MKYLRFLMGEQGAVSGIGEPDGTIELIEGPILGEHTRTGKKIKGHEIRRYLPPVDPPNIIAVGRNYAEHAKELKHDLPTVPLLFMKATTSLTGHRCPVLVPAAAPHKVDYEAELVIVIGKKGKHIKPEEAAHYIFGYTIANDISARDVQLEIDSQWIRGKSFDTFAPLGPAIETELDPSALRVRMFLNGKCMQDGNTRDMIFPVPELVSFISRHMTLLPGTVILTGTPSGVGYGREVPVFLKPGDQLAVEVEGIGRLENPVAAE